MTPPARVVFLGSGGFAVPILDALVASPDVDLAGVLSTPPRPAGRAAELRPTPVAVRAAELGVPVLLPARLRDTDAMAAIAALDADLLVLADYGKIVPEATAGDGPPWCAQPPSFLAAASPGRDTHPGRHRGG